MQKQKAIEKAREDSRNGYVQHVCVREKPRTPFARQSGQLVGEVDYFISDWYLGAATVYSFENGIELGGKL
jgi:hypothetical protein